MTKRFTKYLFFVLAFSVFAFAATNNANASVVTIERDGSVRINVLSFEDEKMLDFTEREYLAVKRVYSDLDSETPLNLLRDNGTAKLSLQTNSGEETLDVSEIEESIVEIEERPKTGVVNIYYSEDAFIINQDGVSAETEYSIKINPQHARIAVSTPTGDKFVATLPKQALTIALQSKYINKLSEGAPFKLFEDIESDVLSYEIKGDKTIDLFDLVDYQVPVSVYISAFTGEIVNVDQPLWLKIVGFLFV